MIDNNKNNSILKEINENSTKNLKKTSVFKKKFYIYQNNLFLYLKKNFLLFLNYLVFCILIFICFQNIRISLKKWCFNESVICNNIVYQENKKIQNNYCYMINVNKTNKNI